MTCERQCEANWGVHLAFYFGQPRIVQYFQASRETARFTLVEDRMLAGETLSPASEAFDCGVAFRRRVWRLGGVCSTETPPAGSLAPQGFEACVACVAFYLGSICFTGVR